MLAHYFLVRFGKPGNDTGRLMLFAGVLMRLYRSWATRDRDCRELARMSDRELRDISMTRYNVTLLISKPFWEP
jgi:uncharacterized protein YjiS (DUF1127 family)